MFARVRAQMGLRRDAILVPQRAVTELQGAYQVAVVDAGNTVHILPVQAGDRVGTEWVIEKGLQAGRPRRRRGPAEGPRRQTVKALPYAAGCHHTYYGRHCPTGSATPTASTGTARTGSGTRPATSTAPPAGPKGG